MSFDVSLMKYLRVVNPVFVLKLLDALADARRQNVELCSTMRALTEPAASTAEHSGAPTIISAEDAAALLDIPCATLYAGARNGEIPCHRVGLRYVFVREPLVAWLRQGNTHA